VFQQGPHQIRRLRCSRSPPPQFHRGQPPPDRAPARLMKPAHSTAAPPAGQRQTCQIEALAVINHRLTINAGDLEMTIFAFVVSLQRGWFQKCQPSKSLPSTSWWCSAQPDGPSSVMRLRAAPSSKWTPPSRTRSRWLATTAHRKRVGWCWSIATGSRCDGSQAKCPGPPAPGSPQGRAGPCPSTPRLFTSAPSTGGVSLVRAIGSTLAARGGIGRRRLP